MKKYLLELIPEKVRVLMDRHRECADKYWVFFESMQQVFAEEFEKDPEGTLERYLSLSDEECAWEKGDFRTRDLLLDNFIARELARELKKELEKMVDVDKEGEIGARGERSVEQLLQENIKLKSERDAYLKKLEKAERERDELKSRLEKALGGDTARMKEEYREKLAQVEQRLREREEYARRLKLYTKNLEAKLQECLQRREPVKLTRMAEIVKLGWKVGGIVPIFAARKLGIKPFMVRKYLSELVEIGMVERVAKGYYMVKEKPEEKLEAAIAKRLAQKSQRRQKQ